MTDREVREEAGARAMFATFKQGDSGRTYYSFTPSSLQFWGGLIIMLATLLAGTWKTAGVFLRPEVKLWVTDDFGPVIREHAMFATKSELDQVSRSIRADQMEGDRRAELVRAELLYLRGRIDAIADRVGAK